MRKEFFLSDFIPELKILASCSPRTEKLQALVKAADARLTFNQEMDPSLRLLTKTPVVASTDRWSEVQYQSLYIRDTDPENRLVLQEPSTPEPSVCVMVLKAARLQGESGMVYCGTIEQLNAFKAKLPEYEKIAEDMSEKDFLECLVEVAQKEFKMKVIYTQVSVEHGGDEMDFDDED